MNLIEAFDLGPEEVISLVGGGGKTTLMFALARQLTEAGYRVITTTTTKIFEPSPWESPCVVLLGDRLAWSSSLQRPLDTQLHLTAASERIPEQKLRGLSPEIIREIKELDLAPYILIEADGAKHHPAKAPNATEPVIPEFTTLVIPVIGIEALGSRLTEDVVFRSELAAKLLQMPLGSLLSAEALATLITHRQGMAKGSPPNARIIPFINKIDLIPNLNQAFSLAGIILSQEIPQISRVILGQANSPKSPVKKIVEPDT